MECPVSGFRPHAGLQQTLQQFHLSSRSSLGGPAAFSARHHHQHHHHQHHPAPGKDKKRADLSLLPGDHRTHSPVVLPGPMLISPDRSSERCETVLERETISCFVVGGERRLCLPQILNTVLRDFTLQQINAVCDRLHIYCSRCTGEQLDILKTLGVLPFSAPSCGLITHTDAQRLCNSLLDVGALLPLCPPSSSSALLHYTHRAFKVYHRCFGKCKGVFMPDLYTSPRAACIQCTECRRILPPDRFVVHGHKRSENRTCHWGFDSSRWRAYILLDQDYTKEEEEATVEQQQLLNELKEKYDLENTHNTSSYSSREYNPVPNKKSKQEPSWSTSEDNEKQVDWLERLAASTTKDLQRIPFKQRTSAFQPWSPRVHPTEIAAPSHKHEHNFTARSQPNNSERLALLPDTLQKNEQPKGSRSGSSQSGSRPAKCWTFGKNQMASVARLAHPPLYESKSNAEIEVDSCDEVPCSHSFTNGVLLDWSDSRHRPIAPPSSELEALRQRLYSNLSSRERFLQDFVHIRVEQEETLLAALQAKHHLQQELEFLQVNKKEQLRDDAEAKHDANETCGGMDESEYEQQMHICEHGCKPSQLRAKYITQIAELQVKLHQAEADREQLRDELLQEHEARQSLEQVVLQLQQQLRQGNRKRGHFSQQQS